MRPSRLSIRARITLGSTIVAVLLLTAAAIVVYSQVVRVVDDGERRVLKNIAEVYRAVLQEDPAEPLEAPGVGQHVEIVDASGRVRLDTMPAGLTQPLDQLDGIDAPTPSSRPDAARLDRVDADGTTYVVYTTELELADGVWRISTARNDESSERVLEGVAALMVGSFAVFAALFAAASWLIASAALRPVGRLRRSAEELAVEDGAERLPEGPAHDEIDQLAGTLNELLDRSQRAAERERQVISDASHELRTPLSLLQGQLELLPDPAVDPEGARRDLAAARTSLARLTAVARSLLDLSRVEAQSTSGHASAGELAAVLADSVDRTRLRVADRHEASAVDLDFAVTIDDPDEQVALSGDDFARVFDNLVDNSLGAAGDRPVRVRASLSQPAGALVLQVDDDAGGLHPEVAGRAFERFVRGPASTYPGGGLGLAIVARLVELAGGTVRLDDRPGSGVTVTVSLPTTS